MTNPTSNFNWQMPTASDLVTDLPADFETFGQAVDTSMAKLKGGTTNQILAKNSGTDMDFKWVANDVGDITAVTAGTGISGGGTSGDVTITNSMATTMTTKGDLVPATGSGTFARLGVGVNDLFLQADSAEATGLKWSGGWITYTPTLTNMTQGNGVIAAYYQKVGKTVFVWFRFDFGSTSSMGSNPRISLPVNSVRTKYGQTGVIADLGTASYQTVLDIGSNKCDFYVIQANGTYANWNSITSTVPMTWGNGDYLDVSFYYEAA